MAFFEPGMFALKSSRFREREACGLELGLRQGIAFDSGLPSPSFNDNSGLTIV